MTLAIRARIFPARPGRAEETHVTLHPRIAHPNLSSRMMSAEDAAALIEDGMTFNTRNKRAQANWNKALEKKRLLRKSGKR